MPALWGIVVNYSIDYCVDYSPCYSFCFLKTLQSFVMPRITEEQIYALLLGLVENKASTDIPVKLIKLASTAVCQPLTTSYNE